MKCCEKRTSLARSAMLSAGIGLAKTWVAQVFDMNWLWQVMIDHKWSNVAVGQDVNMPLTMLSKPFAMFWNVYLIAGRSESSLTFQVLRGQMQRNWNKDKQMVISKTNAVRHPNTLPYSTQSKSSALPNVPCEYWLNHAPGSDQLKVTAVRQLRGKELLNVIELAKVTWRHARSPRKGRDLPHLPYLKAMSCEDLSGKNLGCILEDTTSTEQFRSLLKPIAQYPKLTFEKCGWLRGLNCQILDKDAATIHSISTN